MKLDRARLKNVAHDARVDYEAWKAAHPGEDPVRLGSLPDALWNLERCAERVALLLPKPPVVRRTHSGYSSVRCDICAPLHCKKAK